MRFWSLGRSGLFPVEGRPTIRAFRAAVHVCGAPKVSLGITGDRYHRWVQFELAFHGRGLFRCSFTLRSASWVRSKGSFWYRSNGKPRALKPSRWDNPVTNILNRSLLAGSDPRPLAVWERVLLALGF